jgi:murein DD-endopeptidase MepM/ murein hydrolase activator NlpD
MLHKHTIRLLCVYSIALMLFILILSPIYAATESELRRRIGERNKEIEQLEVEIAAYQKSLSSTSEKSKTLQNEVARVETQIKKLNSDIRLTQSRVAAAELHIEELDSAIQQKENQVALQRSALAQTIQTIYRHDENSFLEIVLLHEKTSNFFGYVETIQKFEQSIYNDLTSLRETKTILEEEHASRIQQKEELSLLNRELNFRHAIEEDTKNEKKVLLSTTRNEEKRYQQLLAERSIKREEMLNEIQRTEDELRALINPSSIPQANQGILAWPLKGGVALTQSFGITPDSKILYNGKPHNGIDLQASVGTKLYAAESGIIKEIGNTDAFPGCLSYGKWILIEHTNNLATLYAHLSQISVTKGASINRGDLIGYTGVTGYATGPHLHFTVYDASTVQFRSSRIPGSNCQYLPYGGYLNPLAYL